VLWGVYSFTEIVRIKPVVGDVIVGKPAAIAGFRSGDQLLSINGEATPDQGGAALGLLDAISDDGDAVLEVRGRDGATRTLTLAVAEIDARRKLTEPNQLFAGLGFDFWAPELPAKLADVLTEGPAWKAGLRPGDLVVAVDGKRMANFREFRDYIQARPGTSVFVEWRREGAKLSSRMTTLDEKDENGMRVGRLSIRGLATESPEAYERLVPEDMKVRSDLGPVAALGAAVKQAWHLTAMQAKFFGRMLTGKISMKNLSSPIGIAGFAGDSARAGPSQFVMFLVLISLSLGFLNLLPIPILDGGQIVFVVAEWLKGSPLSERVQAFGWHAGLVMLALLMGVAVFNDLSSRFG
jgi:regulator of sigma E protease